MEKGKVFQKSVKSPCTLYILSGYMKPFSSSTHSSHTHITIHLVHTCRQYTEQCKLLQITSVVKVYTRYRSIEAGYQKPGQETAQTSLGQHGDRESESSWPRLTTVG